MSSFNNVELRLFDDTSFTCKTLGSRLTLNVDKSHLALFRRSDLIKEIHIGPNVTVSQFGPRAVGVATHKEKGEKSFTSYFFEFETSKDATAFLNCVSRELNNVKLPANVGLSSFDERTDPWSAVQYFQFYSYLSQQQNMMQDYIRTSTYQRAILANASADFRGKVVLDVGAGSGILSFFAIQAGATKVYAVEASNMAAHCSALVQANKLAGRIVVISGKIEEITLPEPVDIIISEPMGYMLYNERMLETYVHARKFLAPHLKQSSRRMKNRMSNGPSHPNKSEDRLDGVGTALDSESGASEDDRSHEAMQDGMSDASSDDELDSDNSPNNHRALRNPGIMFPTVANLYIVPFSDEALFAEQYAKANFWYQQNFHGMDLTALRNAAVAEYFNQPVVDTFDIGLCPALPCVHKVDFRTVSEAQLTTINIPLHFQISTCSTIHGLAFWFDVGFLGSQRDTWLSTAPTQPLTHWYQVRCLLGTPLFVQEGQSLNGHVTMQANSRQSYDVQIELVVPGSQTKITNTLDLKNPHFRYNGYPPAPPPGSHTQSPTEVYYTNLCLQQQQQQQPQPAQNAQIQVQSAPAVGLSMPLVGNAADPTGAATNPLFAAALAHPNLFSSLNSNLTVAQQAAAPASQQPQQQQQQSMQLSPQPAPSTNLVGGVLMNHSALLTAQHHHQQQQPSVVPGGPSIGACTTATLGSASFFNPTSALIAGDEGIPFDSRDSNGWRSSAFHID